MNTLPPIGARVRLSAAALDRLDRSPGRGRANLVGEVVAHAPGPKQQRAVVRWSSSVAPEPLNPIHLELAP
jgi:hypothetical protein